MDDLRSRLKAEMQRDTERRYHAIETHARNMEAVLPPEALLIVSEFRGKLLAQVHRQLMDLAEGFNRNLDQIGR